MSRSLISSLLLSLFLTGCAGQPFNGIFNRNSEETVYSQGSNQHNWYPAPQSGEQIIITDATSGSTMNVTVMESYNAASGRTCALYTKAGNNDNPAGLACRGNDHWADVPFITNPDSRRPANS